jgi:hypothetical protein
MKFNPNRFVMCFFHNFNILRVCTKTFLKPYWELYNGENIQQDYMDMIIKNILIPNVSVEAS